MRKKFFFLTVIGLLIGAASGFLIPWASSGFQGLASLPEFAQRVDGMPAAVILQALLSGLYGAACMWGVLFYDIEWWPVALATSAHYFVIAALFWPLALLLGWADSVGTLLEINAFQLVGFFIIWIIMLLRYRAQVRELNEMQNKEKADESKPTQ